MLRLHYIYVSPARFFLFFVMVLAIEAFVACSGEDNPGNNNKPDVNSDWILEGEDYYQEISDTLDKSLDNLGLANSIVIKFNNEGTPTVNNPYADEVPININNETVVVDNTGTKTEYSFVVSGTAKNGQLKIYGDYKIRLYLNGANITYLEGPAINIQNGKKISVHLIGKNYLTDDAGYAANLPNEKAKGTLFSEGQLYFYGGGSLEVKAKYGHAIVTDDFFEMESGKIIVLEAVKDGIHANDEITIKGGTIRIASTGDAFQSERASIKISAGKIKAQTTGIKSHGITSETFITINGNTDIEIRTLGNASKGIKSKGFMAIEDGKIDIKTSGNKYIDNSVNPPDTSTAAGIKADSDMEISGGVIRIKSTGDNARGINADGNITISNGDINIEADGSGIKLSGNLNVSGGNIYSKSLKKSGVDCKGEINDPRGLIHAENSGF